MDVLPDYFPRMYYKPYECGPETRGEAGKTHCHAFPERLHRDALRSMHRLAAGGAIVARALLSAVEAHNSVSVIS